MNAAISELSRVPRTISKELESLVPEEHRLATLGARIVGAGVLLTVACAALAAIGHVPWIWSSAGAVAIAVGLLMRQFVMKEALAKGRERLARMPLCMVTIVQANRVLYDREDATTAPAVLMYTKGSTPEHADFLLELAPRVAQLRGARPTGVRELDLIGERLDDEQSHFNIALPPSLTGGAQVVIGTTYLRPDQIPGRCLQCDTVMLGLLDEQGRLFKLIPPSAYSRSH